jgi:hypothetical protein
MSEIAFSRAAVRAVQIFSADRRPILDHKAPFGKDIHPPQLKDQITMEADDGLL